MAPTNRSICADVGTCGIYCGQCACPKERHGSLTEPDDTDDAMIYKLFNLGWNNEILAVLKPAGILAPPARCTCRVSPPAI